MTSDQHVKVRFTLYKRICIETKGKGNAECDHLFCFWLKSFTRGHVDSIYTDHYILILMYASQPAINNINEKISAIEFELEIDFPMIVSCE